MVFQDRAVESGDRIAIFFRFRGGFPPDSKMVKKRTGKFEADKRKGVQEPTAFKEERIQEEYDQAIQVQWQSEYRTSLVFRWWKSVWLLNVWY